MEIIKDFIKEIVQSAEDLETMASFAMKNNDSHLGRMCLAQYEESLNTVYKYKDEIKKITGLTVQEIIKEK